MRACIVGFSDVQMYDHFCASFSNTVFCPQEIVSANAALEEVKQSGKFSKILELILLMGNFMNSGSRNEMTIGFELGYISKVELLQLLAYGGRYFTGIGIDIPSHNFIISPLYACI